MATIFKRGRTWYSKMMVGGQEVRKALSADRRTAEGKLADLIRMRNAHRHGHAPSDVSWAEFRREYLEKSKNEKKKPTWQGEERAFRLLEEVIPVQRLSQITPALLDRAKTLWIKKKRGTYVINRDLRAIRTAIHKAEAWGYIPKQDWSAISYIKTPKGRLHYLNVEELKKLRKICHGVWETLLLLGSRAGLRRAEMYHLEWTDIDFERNRIHIAPKPDWIPKDYERRWVPLAADLREHLKRCHASRPDRWVLSDKDGRPSLDSLSVYFRRLVHKARLQGNIHTLRHTFGSHLAMAGVPLYTIAKLLGHSKVETTQIYAHLSPETMDNAVEKLPAID